MVVKVENVINRTAVLLDSELVYTYFRRVMNNNESCVLCGDLFCNDDDMVCLRQKGADGVNTRAEQKGDTLRVVVGTKVHKKCRLDYIRKTSDSSLPNVNENIHSTPPQSSVVFRAILPGDM